MTEQQAINLFNHLLNRAEEKMIPLWTHLDLTYRCNLSCIHCYCQGISGQLWENRGELSFQEIKQLLDDLAGSGALYLTLSGGEVFLRRDFFEIAFYAKKKNFCLSVFTNGTLIDENKARRLADLSPLAVEMSIYGVTPEVHDSITNLVGSFEKLLKAVGIFKKYGLRVVLKTVFMKPNFHQVHQIERFAYDIGTDDFRSNIEISPKNDGSKLPLEYQLDTEEMASILSKTDESEVEYQDNPLRKPLCATGSLGCYISPYGDVYPCIQLLIPMGNIREKSFQEIWHAPSELRSQLSLLKTYADLLSCKSCQYVRYCKKCLGLSYLETKDMRACYPALRDISRITSGEY
ncbi:MAG: radical SAM protein [Candidatus Omnitrophica bacterium]|nr:radical SAM protein [Candidatus Omnitrophota bacterium]